MRQFAMVAVALGLTAAWAGSAAAEVELKNDGFAAGGTAAFQTGFASGEMAGVRFVAPSSGRTLVKVQLLFGGAMTTQTVIMRVFEDSAGNDTPGAELYMGEVQLLGSDTAMHEVILADVVVVPQQFRVAIEFQHGGAPAVAADTDGVTADKNFIYAGSWARSSTFGLQGDWIIRAFVTDTGAPDAGVGAGCRVNNECMDGKVCVGGSCVDPTTMNPVEDDDGCSTGALPGAGGALVVIVALLSVSRRRPRLR